MSSSQSLIPSSTKRQRVKHTTAVVNTTTFGNLRQIGIILVWVALLSGFSVKAFSLLGPTPAWMSATNLWHYPGEIGGPMETGQEYRRNVNVLTYGFDQSFLNYFGNAGVLAVQQAFAALNRLPGATRLNVNRCPTNTVYFNEAAYDAYIMDLKLVTLHTVLEEMGLSSPLRYVWTLRYMDDALLNNPSVGDEFTMSSEQIATYMRQLSFDPVTFQASRSVNGTDYTFQILTSADNLSFSLQIPTGPVAAQNTPVADGNAISYGLFTTGLTRDDVGGLKYLLQYRNVNVETYDPSVQIRLANRGLVARTGPHLGVDKITFVKHRANRTGAFVPMTFKSAIYVLNSNRVEKALATRLVTKPDFLFCGGHVTNGWVQRSGTSNWINNSAANNKPGADGPGVIAGQTQITFETNTVFIYGSDSFQWHWGNISSSTNAVILGPSVIVTR